MRISLRFPVGLALLATAVVATGCAKHKSNDSDERPHPVEVEVNNNLAIPTEITVWLVQTTGTRQMLGSVPGTETKTFKFTPITYSQEYRLIAERQLARTIYSQPFTVGSPDTGLLQWGLLENIIGFRDFVDDSATAKP